MIYKELAQILVTFGPSVTSNPVKCRMEGYITSIGKLCLSPFEQFKVRRSQKCFLTLQVLVPTCTYIPKGDSMTGMHFRLTRFT